MEVFSIRIKTSSSWTSGTGTSSSQRPGFASFFTSACIIFCTRKNSPIKPPRKRNVESRIRFQSASGLCYDCLMISAISHEAAEKWARSLYENSVDRKDAAGFAKVFAPSGKLRFGNNPPLVGPAEIESAIAQFFQAMASLRHEFVAISCDGDTVFLEAKVTYTRHDGAIVTVPAMTVFVMADTDNLRAQECRIYVDLAPLFAPTQD